MNIFLYLFQCFLGATDVGIQSALEQGTHGKSYYSGYINLLLMCANIPAFYPIVQQLAVLRKSFSYTSILPVPF